MILPPHIYKILKGSDLSSEKIQETLVKLKAGELSLPSEPIKVNTQELKKETTSYLKQQDKQVKVVLSPHLEGRRASIFSLKNTLSQKMEAQELDSTQEIVILQQKEFSEAELKEVWQQIQELCKKDRKNASEAMSYSLLQLNEAFQVNVLLQNGVLIKHIESEKDFIQLELRKRLQNGSIKLLLQVSEEAKIERLPYTKDEIYAHMLKINPLLAELCQKFKLDIQ